MSTQRKVQFPEDALEQAHVPGASGINQPLGGQVALWQDQIRAAFRDGMPQPGHIATHPVEQMISNISRWSGPTIFVAALATLIYIL